MARISSTWLSKGIFGLGVVAIAGIVGAVHFAQAAVNQNVSGYGTSSQQAIAAADKFQNSLNVDTNTFSQQNEAAIAAAKAKLTPQGQAAVDQFNSSYAAATGDYAAATNSAFETFRSQVLAAANTAESKDQFIDKFNHAKADYFNSLDAAKNQLADKLNRLGMNSADVAKDQFMNSFNSNRDAYGNKIEQLKNDFAATLG